MSQSYRLTEDGLQIRNSRNFETEEYVRFESINPLAQALRDYIVTGPGLIPGISAASVCLQAHVVGCQYTFAFCTCHIAGAKLRIAAESA